MKAEAPDNRARGNAGVPFPAASKSRSTSGKARGGGYARFRRPGGQATVRCDGGLLPAPGKAMPSRRTQECRAPRAPEGSWNARKDVAPCFREGRIKAGSTPVDQGLPREPCGAHAAVRDARILPGASPYARQDATALLRKPGAAGAPLYDLQGIRALYAGPRCGRGFPVRPARHRPLYAETRCGRGFPVRPARHSRCTAGTRR